jgi:hypothetical protein
MCPYYNVPCATQLLCNKWTPKPQDTRHPHKISYVNWFLLFFSCRGLRPCDPFWFGINYEKNPWCLVGLNRWKTGPRRISTYTRETKARPSRANLNLTGLREGSLTKMMFTTGKFLDSGRWLNLSYASSGRITFGNFLSIRQQAPAVSSLFQFIYWIKHNGLSQ